MKELGSLKALIGRRIVRKSLFDAVSENFAAVEEFEADLEE